MLKRCAPEDLARLLDFYQLVIRETETMPRYGRWIYGLHPTEEMIRESAEQGALYYAEYAQTVIGAVVVTPFQTEEYHGIDWEAELRDGEAAVVHLLAIHPQRQRLGLAKAVMRDVITLAKAQGKKAVRLDTLSCNLPAQRLYDALGFRKRSVRNSYACNVGRIDFCLYEYPL